MTKCHHCSYHSIESDPVFANVGSEEFVQVFVHHDIPAIATVSTILLSIAEKEVALQEVQREIDQLRQEQELNIATSGDERAGLSIMT